MHCTLWNQFAFVMKYVRWHHGWPLTLFCWHVILRSKPNPQKLISVKMSSHQPSFSSATVGCFTSSPHFSLPVGSASWQLYTTRTMSLSLTFTRGKFNEHDAPVIESLWIIEQFHSFDIRLICLGLSVAFSILILISCNGLKIWISLIQARNWINNSTLWKFRTSTIKKDL